MQDMSTATDADTTITLTIDEAAAWLDPPIGAAQLKAIVIALRIRPAASRHAGAPGRPANAYDAAELMRLHAAIAPWLSG
jgi:hypothetical protein